MGPLWANYADLAKPKALGLSGPEAVGVLLDGHEGANMETQVIAHVRHGATMGPLCSPMPS